MNYRILSFIFCLIFHEKCHASLDLLISTPYKAFTSSLDSQKSFSIALATEAGVYQSIGLSFGYSNFYHSVSRRKKDGKYYGIATVTKDRRVPEFINNGYQGFCPDLISTFKTAGEICGMEQMNTKIKMLSLVPSVRLRPLRGQKIFDPYLSLGAGVSYVSISNSLGKKNVIKPAFDIGLGVDYKLFRRVKLNTEAQYFHHGKYQIFDKKVTISGYRLLAGVKIVFGSLDDGKKKKRKYCSCED